MLVATNGAESYPVGLMHWWPGREFHNPNLTRFFEMAARHAHGGDTLYITVGYVIIGPSLIQGVAYCCPKDKPSRKRGRQIALGRLGKELRRMGYRLECGKGAGE